MTSALQPLTPPPANRAGADHPALEYFVDALRHLEEGRVDSSAEAVAKADLALRATPIDHPAIHAKLVEAHGRLMACANESQAGLRAQMNQSGRARRAVSHYQ